VRRSGLNKISAATFAHIGRSGEEEKYVMGSGGEDSNTSRQEVVLYNPIPEYRYLYDTYHAPEFLM
jgi:hypothetical protein